jgi:hypothetical protein
MPILSLFNTAIDHALRPGLRGENSRKINFTSATSSGIFHFTWRACPADGRL